MSREIYLVGSVPMANARDVFANVSAALGTLMHMPVPRNRADDTYFLPLQQLALRLETKLCLGLVHYTDGVEGTRRRLATAKRHVPDIASSIAIATECGFGRRDPATIPELLRIHAVVADDA